MAAPTPADILIPKGTDTNDLDNFPDEFMNHVYDEIRFASTGIKESGMGKYYVLVPKGTFQTYATAI
jgi:hypothetical protein